jgi:alanine racemase
MSFSPQLSTSPATFGGCPHRCYVEVSLPQIRENFLSIAEALKPKTEIMPVVKANAYGHGAIRVAQTLTNAGARWLAVSNTSEGVALRRAGIPEEVRIIVMAGILPFEWQSVVECHLTPVLHQMSDLATVEEISASTGTPLRFHIKVDTGLSRLGLRESIGEIARALLSLKHSQFEGVMTHLASAANVTSPQTDEQLKAFDRAVSGLREAGLPPFMRHVDATNSLHLVEHDTEVHLIRPGLAVYGYVTEPSAPVTRGKLQVKPALSWKARIILVKDLPAGVSVGYGATYTTTKPTTIAVLAVGYSDGYPHQQSNKGAVLVNGHQAPIVGAVSMDVTTIDVSGIPGVSAGGQVTLLGSEGDLSLDATQVGRNSGTIPYSILCNIHERVPRIYVD